MNQTTCFSPDYATARQRFRQAASRAGWSLEAHGIGVAGPDGAELTIEVACSPAPVGYNTLVVSSGLHGVEGFFGSALQLAALEQWASQWSEQRPPVRCVFLHALNPYGFAWLRRVDENNVDPNRNFLLNGEKYAGSPQRYAALDALLNPRRPPSAWEPFRLKALFAIARYGMPALSQAIAGGQYDYPRGLFYGGALPSIRQHILGENLERWLAGSSDVVHLDLHSGLGKNRGYKLLIDDPLTAVQGIRLAHWFSSDGLAGGGESDKVYRARGGFGRWLAARNRSQSRECLSLCAEFGTHGLIDVIAGLRAENQAHHWGSAGAQSTTGAKQRLRELFCPESASWRTQALDCGMDLLNRALRGLAQER